MAAVEHYTVPDKPTPPEELEAGARVLVRRCFIQDDLILQEEASLRGTVDHIPDWEAINEDQVALSGARTYFNIALEGGNTSAKSATEVVPYGDRPAICNGQRCVLRTYFYLLPDLIGGK